MYHDRDMAERVLSPRTNSRKLQIMKALRACSILGNTRGSSFEFDLSNAKEIVVDRDDEKKDVKREIAEIAKYNLIRGLEEF